MLYYVIVPCGPSETDIKGPYISLRVAKYVAYHVKPIPGLSAATIAIIDRTGNVISEHIETWGVKS